MDLKLQALRRCTSMNPTPGDELKVIKDSKSSSELLLAAKKRRSMPKHLRALSHLEFFRDDSLTLSAQLEKYETLRGQLVRVKSDPEKHKFQHPKRGSETTNILDLLIHMLTKDHQRLMGGGLDENCIRWLIREARHKVKRESALLELEAPIKICGDFHGQFHDVLSLFETCGSPSACKYLVMGDFVDRGKNSLETILLLMAYKVRHPTQMFLIRGNHECESINKQYGFFDECKRKYNI